MGPKGIPAIWRVLKAPPYKAKFPSSLSPYPMFTRDACLPHSHEHRVSSC